MNKFPFTGEDLVKKLDDSQEFMDRVTTGFLERNERIFYRRPSVNSRGQMEYDDLVDNTLSSYLEKMPKNVIQKMPTFTIDAHTRSKAEDLVYEYIAVKILLRAGSSKGYSLLQKQWIELRNSATFGVCAVYLPFENDHGEFTVGEYPIYWGDLYPEAWSSNVNSNNFNQFRTLKTEDDIKALIAGDDEEVGGTWDKKALQEVLDFGTGQSSGRNDANIKAAMEGLPEHMYELFVYTDKNWVVYWHYASGKILRVMPNRSGRRRVIGLYSDYDGTSIMGRSLVDMAYPAQQSLTSLLRNFVYASDYNTDPAKTVKGVALDDDNFNLTKGNTMFLGDEQGEVDLLPVDTTTIQNFPNLYQLLKAVLLNSLPSSNDTSISAGVGDLGHSKTQAGVNDQAEKADVEHNYYRKNYETFFEMSLENKLNIYIAEVKALADANGAVPMVELDEEYANLVREQFDSAEAANEFINAQNQVRLDLSSFRGVNVSVDFESTRDLAKEEDLKRLNNFMTGFFEAAKSDPSMAQVMRAVLPLLMEEMTKSSNLENSAKISQVMQEALEQARIEEQQAKEMEAQEKNQQLENVKAPTVNISFKDLPPAGKIQAAAKYGIELRAEDVMLPVEGAMLPAEDGGQDVGV